MMQSRRREKAMLETVSRLRRLLRKADLATKCVRVMASEIFYTATSPRCRRGLPCLMLRSETGRAASLRGTIGAVGRARRPSLHRMTHDAVAALPGWIMRKFCATRGAESCLMAYAARHPQSEPRVAACAGRGGRKQSRGVLCRECQRARSLYGGRRR